MNISAHRAQAEAQVEGNVLLSGDQGATFYADDPFTTTINEGIPRLGNSINENQGLNAQTNFEGRPDLMGTATTVDDVNVNFDIYVGYTSFGELIINGGTELRDMNLIIGDSGTLPGGQIRRGTGVVRIENPGSVYNNDPLILPYPFYLTGDSPSINDRIDEMGFGAGFDLFVGAAGNGTLSISLGGRAEIQDAAIVGDASGSVGTLLIDGIDSFLQSGGMETDDEVEPHYMIVGRLGSGTMRIQNGGQSYNLGPTLATSGGGNDFFGAVIGSNFAADDTGAPATAGQGTVYVDGTASKWTVGGNLQVGGFHDSCDDGTTGCAFDERDLEGNLAIYGSGVGRGTLSVTNGGLVSIITPPLDDTGTNAPDRLDLLIGRFGRVEMDGGRIELLGAFSSNDPNNPTQEVTRGRLINDGVLSGDGSISVLQFRNRVLGEVRVGAGQKLLVEATGTYTEPDNIPALMEQEYPLSNYGLIEVLGTNDARAEIEFDRNQVTIPTADDFTRPFLNLPVPLPIAPNGRTEGKILGQDAIMRFRSGLDNFADFSFTGGTNIVAGAVVNEIGGTVFVDGAGTTVTFEDRVSNFGHFALEPNISLITLNSDFMMGGTAGLSTTFGGRPTGQEISHLAAAGDITLGGALSASLFTAPGVPGFSPQPGDQFEILSAAGELLGDFATVNLPGCIGTLCFVGFPDYTLDSYFIRAFSIAAAVGADFNGDGIVDDLDLQIWRQNVGGPGPVGDANGDGIVNGQDLFLWQMQLGGPGIPGAGGGGGGLASNSIPEPTSAVLLVGGLLALAVRRRRTA